MHAKTEQWKSGWFGVELGLSLQDIDRRIELLQMLKKEPDQHFHVSSDYKGIAGIGDIEFYVQFEDEANNMLISGKAIAPNR